jgi:hypothetical protein
MNGAHACRPEKVLGDIDATDSMLGPVVIAPATPKVTEPVRYDIWIGDIPAIMHRTPANATMEEGTALAAK